ncbi:MAG: ATP-dependent Clp protease adaptor ClpS [Tahibacter sp.]
MTARVSQRPGSIRIATIRGAPVFVHWSFPAGGLVLSALAEFHPLPTLYFVVAYTLLIVLHEFGHLVAAWSLGLTVFAVDISGIGGICRIQMPRTVRDRAIVFSAGLIAQIILLLATLAFFHWHGPPHTPLTKCVAITFILVNSMFFAINLIPGKSHGGLSNDGMILWQLYQHVFRGHRLHAANPVDVSPVYSTQTSLLTIAALVPPDFVTGVEIFNDNTTPMDFVVHVLTRHLQLDSHSAAQLMLAIHTHGGVLVPLVDRPSADAVALAITTDARANGYALLCRAVQMGET